MSDETMRRYVGRPARETREPQFPPPWVCQEFHCDEARPGGEAQRPCPRCGSPMMRGGRFLHLEISGARGAVR